MTGLDLLKEKLRSMGANKAQVESSTVPMVLTALSGNPDWIKIGKAEKLLADYDLKTRHAVARLEEVIQNLNNRKMEYSELYKQLGELKGFESLEREKEKYSDWFKSQTDYINQFNESMKNCETAEGRDAMKAAQLFINSINISTVYDNTAFINGLASILSGKPVGDLKNLKKVDGEMSKEKLPLSPHQRKMLKMGMSLDDIV